jgi:MscS family membrane protein
LEYSIETLKNFWQLTLDVWKTGVLGVDIGRLVMAIAIFMTFLILRRLFTRFVLVFMKRMARQTSSNFDDHAIEVLEDPIRFIPIVMGTFFVI